MTKHVQRRPTARISAAWSARRGICLGLYWLDGQWKKFAAGTSIGNCRLVRGQPMTNGKVRLRITKAPVCPAISETGLFVAKS